MEVTSGDYTVRETSLTDDDSGVFQARETDLTDSWNDSDSDMLRKINSEYSTGDEVSSQASFSDICDDFSRFLNQDGDLYEIKETDLTEDDSFLPKETSLNDSSCLRETNLLGSINVKETDLTESTNIKETDLLGAFEYSYHTNSPSVSLLLDEEIDEKDATDIKETSLVEYIPSINSKSLHGVKETELLFNESDYVKETDLIGSDDELNCLDSVMKYSSENIELLNDQDNVLSDSEKTDTYGEVINRDANVNFKDGNNDFGVNFQDIDTDFFETDCENNTEYSKMNLNSTAHKFDFLNENKKMENVDVNIAAIQKANYFQDIESDFFDEDIEQKEYLEKNESSNTTMNTKIDTKMADSNKNKEMITPSDSSKTSSMSNTLLRSTINELERALNDSNLLLAKRDQKIQQLRTRNTEILQNFSKEAESCSEMKLLLLEKETLLSEQKMKINGLQSEIFNMNTELSDLRLYKHNSLKCSDATISFSPTSSFDMQEVDSPANTNERSSTNYSKREDCTANREPVTKCKYKSQRNDDCTRYTPNVNDIKKLEEGEKNNYNKSYQANELTDQTTNHYSRTQSLPPSEDKISKTELHSNLRMRFMRDAFFYYMIGFHPDEQISAILAILDYGDKRQDFVLEAHKMKKTGKKFSASKVSSRGLTFVQQEIK